jgi:hypothetical protein
MTRKTGWCWGKERMRRVFSLSLGSHTLSRWDRGEGKEKEGEKRPCRDASYPSLLHASEGGSRYAQLIGHPHPFPVPGQRTMTPRPLAGLLIVMWTAVVEKCNVRPKGSSVNSLEGDRGAGRGKFARNPGLRTSPSDPAHRPRYRQPAGSGA